MSRIFSVLSGIQQPPALPARSDFPTCDALAVQPGSLAGSNQLLPGAEAPDFTQLEKSCLAFSTSISHSACIKMKARGVHPHKSPLAPRSAPRSAHIGTKATSLSPQCHQDPALPGVFPQGRGVSPGVSLMLGVVPAPPAFREGKYTTETCRLRGGLTFERPFA